MRPGSRWHSVGVSVGDQDPAGLLLCDVTSVVPRPVQGRAVTGSGEGRGGGGVGDTSEKMAVTELPQQNPMSTSVRRQM